MRVVPRHVATATAVFSLAAALVAAAAPALASTAARQSQATTSPNDSLQAVAASSASNAWAVGYSVHGGAELTLTEHWNGSRWTLVPSPSPGGSADHSLLHGVAVRSSQAWAVGFTHAAKGFLTLIEHWNGSAWKLVPSPNPGGTSGDNYLKAVAYASRSRAWAVGYSAATVGGVEQALIERWNGASWKVTRTPKIAGSALYGVAVVSPSDAWAVGYVGTGTGQAQTLTEHWNGTAWSRVPSPDPMTYQVLDSVSAVSASDVWAAGYYNNGSQIQTFMVHWNGSSWALVPTPDVGGGTGYNELNGVTAVSSSKAWAVGYYGAGTKFDTLTLTWNGSYWNYVASPNPGLYSNYLYAVAMTSTSAPWTVGETTTNSGQVTLAERWNGTKWVPVTSPNK